MLSTVVPPIRYQCSIRGWSLLMMWKIHHGLFHNILLIFSYWLCCRQVISAYSDKCKLQSKIHTYMSTEFSPFAAIWSSQFAKLQVLYNVCISHIKWPICVTFVVLWIPLAKRYINKVTIQDLQTRQVWHFFCDCWMSADRGDGMTKKTFNAAKNNEIASFRSELNPFTLLQ